MTGAAGTRDIQQSQDQPLEDPGPGDGTGPTVNSYDEWSPLKEVVLGSGLNHDAHELDFSFRLFFHDEAHGAFYSPGYGAPGAVSVRREVKKRYVEELNEDIESMADALRQGGVTVHRPMPLTAAGSVRTPAWEAGVMPALNVRDQTLVLGGEIIETPPQVRARYFESHHLKPLFYEYFQRGARWTVMPRPVMTDRSFDTSYVSGSTTASMQYIADPHPSQLDVGTEMMIDAAQCVRFGQDVLVNVSTRNHQLGFEWLQRHTAGRFRLHRVYRLADNHLDSIVLALRPGVLLVRDPSFVPRLPEPLRRWKIIFPPKPDLNAFLDYEADDLVLTSPFIDLNVLSLSPDTITVNALCPELIRSLEGHGFTVVPVRHRHRRLFGGGFHCFTLDTVREGSGPENYFD